MTSPTSSDRLWFLNTLVTVCVSQAGGKDNISVLECSVPQGDSPPLHIHHTEDEVFQILEGEFTVRLQDEDRRVGPGEIFLAPKGVPHTYRAESPDGGRFLTTTIHGDFENFVHALGRPAERPGLPDAVAPSPEAIQFLTETAAKFGIEFVGPPIS